MGVCVSVYMRPLNICFTYHTDAQMYTNNSANETQFVIYAMV